MEEAIPNGWTLCSVEETAGLLRGVSYKKHNATKSSGDGYKPILRANNINGTINFNDLVYLPESLIAEAQLLRKGDILFAMSSGSKHLVGKSARISENVDAGFGAFCGTLRPTGIISDKYLAYIFEGPEFRYRISEISKGSNINNLKREHILDYSFPLPPLNEQKRIVEKIEALFSEIDAGVASLQRARAQLGVYRQSLLKKAFTGELTAQWRQANPDQIEPAEELLQRIRQEREARYQQQVDDWKTAVQEWEAKGKEGKKPAKPRKPKPLELLDEVHLEKLHKLPDGWLWVNTGNLIEEPSYGTSRKCSYESRGYGVLRIPNIVEEEVDPADLKFAPFTEIEASQYSLTSGDILMIRSNGSVSIVGRCALVRKCDEQYLYAGYLIRIRPLAKVVDSPFMVTQLRSHSLRNQIEQAAKSTSGVNNINAKEIQRLHLAICSLPEQKEIVRLLEAQFEAIEQNEREIDAALTRADALRQSILKKAFSGQLVPQDSNDEPASALLDRIRQEREATAGMKPNKKAARKRASKKQIRTYLT